MAFPKHGRQEQRRSPATYILTGAILVAAFFIAVWVFSTPTAIPEGGSTAKSTTDASTAGGGKTEAFEDVPEGTSASDEPVAGDTPKVPAADEKLTESTEEPLEKKEDAPTEGESVAGDKELVKEEPKPDDSKPGETLEEKTDTGTAEPKSSGKHSGDDLPPVDASQSEVTTDSKPGDSTWKSQAKESKDEKEVIENSGSGDVTPVADEKPAALTEEEKKIEEKQEEAKTPVIIEDEVSKKAAEKYKWKLCDWKDAQDYIPCLDNKKWLDTNKARKHYEHRERHCPTEEELPKCLVPLPSGYKAHVKWADSRDEVWYDNVPHPGLVSYKADQNWVKKVGNKLKFPGGGTQFKHGAGHYIDFVQKIYPAIGWGNHTRVLLDVGCGVASFGGYLYDREVLAMSFAPKDEHEAQVQLALERGIPAFSSVMGTQRLVFPSNSFDVVHCARCRVPWHLEGGMLLLELNRVLRPGGLFVWSATPVYQDLEEDQKLWIDTTAVTESMGWKMVAKENDEETEIGVAIFQKPTGNEAYESRTVETPELCADENNPNAAWYVKMTPCIHKIPNTQRSEWPEEWPLRVKALPKSLSNKDVGLYGKAAPEDYRVDAEHWDNVVQKTYLTGLGIDWSTIRNVMDMKAGYGGFAAALISQKVWVLNIVPTSEPDTLPIIYDRGLIGMYHDWCEPHSTYPRTYDLLHADHLVSSIENNIVNLVMEMDRILRPDGWAIFRDKKETLAKVEEIVKSLHWDVTLTFSKENEELLAVQKRFWRPDA